MQFIDLRAQQDRIRAELDQRLAKVLDHGKYIMGPEIRELEDRLSEYVGVRHTVSCASGTDALLMALMAEGVGPGDAIVTTPFTFIATAEVISLLGATPVFVDIEPETFNIDPRRLAEADARVRAQPGLKLRGIIVVNLFGLCADYEAIRQYADERDMFVLEDAAQSFGATRHGKRSGSLGHVGATSFFPAKPLGCYGDGGAIFTDDDELAELLRSIRVHGQGKDKYSNLRIGVNGRMDTMQAAVLLAKLGLFPEELCERQRVADVYSSGLEECVEVPRLPQGYTSAWAQYSILSDRREDLRQHLSEQGIPTAVYYTTPLHLQPAFANLGYSRGDFEVSERCAERIVSLPMHPYLKAEDQEKIVQAVRSCLVTC